MEFKLATYRRMNGMTQQSVAEALGISVSLYNGLETGKRRMNETYLAALVFVTGQKIPTQQVKSGRPRERAVGTNGYLQSDSEQWCIKCIL